MVWLTKMRTNTAHSNLHVSIGTQITVRYGTLQHMVTAIWAVLFDVFACDVFRDVSSNDIAAINAESFSTLNQLQEM